MYFFCFHNHPILHADLSLAACHGREVRGGHGCFCKAREAETAALTKDANKEPECVEDNNVESVEEDVMQG
jgi:hypothetical protein